MPAPTPAGSMERKLTAILSADVAGYSRLMGEDEEATIRTLTAYRKVMATLIRHHRGRVVDSPGDNLLAEFASVVDAVHGAVSIQHALKGQNVTLPDHRKMEFRIGINLGDVVVEGERLYGDGVNIAARLESLAEPGGMCISGTVYDQVETKVALPYEYVGEQTVKNIAKPVRVYRVMLDEAAWALAEQMRQNRVSQPPVHPRRRLRRIAGGALLMLGVGVLAGMWYLEASLPFLHRSPPVTQSAPGLPLPDKPSIVVLPFTNMSGNPDQDYFSDGITEDITTDLSKISGLFVISRHSAFTYKGKAVKVQDVSREMGVRYILEGSVRKAGDQLRITAQLIDGTTGGHVWSERYDRLLHDIFALQDEITQRIVTVLRVEMQEAELERVRRVPTENLTAYDSLLRGVEYFWRVTPEANTQARQLFERAITLDPQYVTAYVGLGWTYWNEWLQLWNPNPRNLERTAELAQKALTLDGSDPGGHSLLSSVYLYKRQHEQAITEGEQALALDPNRAQHLLWLAIILDYAGRPQEAIELVEKARRLDPLNPAPYLPILGLAYILTGRYEEAIASQQRAIVLHPYHLYAHVNLTASYSEAGREEEARAAAAEVLRISPKFSVEAFGQRMPFKDPADLERFLAALRKAGLE